MNDYQAIYDATKLNMEYVSAVAIPKMEEVANEYMRPSVLYRPALSIDGDKWCALYGANLQDGVAGFGDSPALAMCDFDKAWWAKI